MKKSADKPFKRIYQLLKRTGGMRFISSYFIILVIGGIITSFIEPDIKNPAEGIYFCFIASTTVGFGDIVPVTVLGRLITSIITVIGILTVAFIPGIIVSYYMEYLKIRENETISEFLEQLEHLPELSKEELQMISDRVKIINKKK